MTLLNSELGQYAKSSLRADVFRYAPNIGRYSAAQFMGIVSHPAEGKAMRSLHSPRVVFFELMLSIGVDRINQGNGPKWHPSVTL
jgi:hypothetical protein